jgi:AcrR family transcriptional regulator
MGDKARQILATAEKLFASGRYDEVTLDEICESAGVGKGTIYRYFHDKEDLYWQVILSGLDELVASVRQVGEQEQDPGRSLRTLVERVTEFFTERGALFGLMSTVKRRGSGRKKKVWKQWRAKEDEIVGVAAEFIAQGVQSGRYATELGPAGAARLLLGMVRTALWHWQEMPGGRHWHQPVVDLFEKGLLVRDEHGSS